MSTVKRDKAWPPLGWESLKKHNISQGQSLIKNSQTACVRGLSYKIVSDALHVVDQNFYIHSIQIDAWEYTIHNASNEFPVLQLKIMDRFDQGVAEEYYVSNIKSMSCPVDLNGRAVRRTMQLMRFFFTQIDQGFVPDVNKALRMYRLHPLQLEEGRKMTRPSQAWPMKKGKLKNIDEDTIQKMSS